MKTAVPNPDPPSDPSFSLNTSALRDILDYARPLGHHEDSAGLNLGFGFVYYGLVRALRPRHALVIGSGFGFSVVCFALGLKDNCRGSLTFVDPSYSVFKEGPFRTIGGTAHWDDPQKVRAHFRRFGVERVVTHHKLTSAEFFADYEARGLPAIDLAFIDGSHAYADVRNDFANVLHHARRNSYILLHDSNIYVRELVRPCGRQALAESGRDPAELFRSDRFSVGLRRCHRARAAKRIVGAALLTLIVILAAGFVAAALAYLLWRHVWFFRNPPRTPPTEAGIVSPADGTVVYVRTVEPGEEVVVIKMGMRATVKDILRQDVDEPKVVIGIFMNPFNVHFNRAPVEASVGFIRHYPALGGNAYMGAMHWRTFFGVEPYYADSVHIVQNERTVTYFAGQYHGAALLVYVVQIGARTVNGIDSYCRAGDYVARGDVALRVTLTFLQRRNLRFVRVCHRGPPRTQAERSSNCGPRPRPLRRSQAQRWWPAARRVPPPIRRRPWRAIIQSQVINPQQSRAT